MSAELMALAPALFQIGVLSALLALSARLVRESGRALAAVFLTFVFSLWLLTDLYWVIYDIMRPDARMPFAANEIGEAAVFLLEAAMLASLRRGSGLARGPAIGALIFAACNVALWVGWSGEWADDLFIGTAYGCFLAQLAVALDAEDLLRRGEGIAVAAGCALLALGEGLTFLLPEAAKALDLGCSLLMVGGAAYWGLKLRSAWRGGAVPALCLVYALLGWILTAKYMSAGGWYALFMICETLCLPLLYLAARRAVAE